MARLGGTGLHVADLDVPDYAPPEAPGVVRIGVRRGSAMPAAGHEAYDILICGDPAAPRPWVGVTPERLDAAVAQLRAAVLAQPAAASVAAQVLRMSLHLEFEAALALESLAYSMLLASGGFRAWRAARPVRERGDAGDARVAVTRDADGIEIRMTRPAARNAVDAAMRDALFEAFEYATLDPDQAPVRLSGAGAAFSAGGDLDEFGRFGDPAEAHLVRVLRMPVRLIWPIRERVTAQVHGACIGAGIEMPAAAGRVIARPDARFRLPEVAMGLIPGAGGTATIPRRIGRRRAAYMALSGVDIDAATALSWGLVDAVEP